MGMQYFLKVQNERVWNTIEFGWCPLKVFEIEGRQKNVIKTELKWWIEVKVKLVRIMSDSVFQFQCH